MNHESAELSPAQIEHLLKEAKRLTAENQELRKRLQQIELPDQPLDETACPTGELSHALPCQ